MSTGGIGSVEPADQAIQDICDKIKPQVIKMDGRNFGKFKAVKYASQVVAGINYFVKSKTYMCNSQGEVVCFAMDFISGFTCFDSKSKNILWRFKFSQLKGSSDDGKTRVKLLFLNSDSKQIEMKELEFHDLTSVLHCIHSFIAAKVASMDPMFVDSQSIARKYIYNT